jgi:hypothetical protein
MKLRRIILHAAFALLILAGFAGTPVLAASSGAATAPKTNAQDQVATGSGSVSGYASDSVLRVGTIVQLEGSNGNKVAPATSKNPNQMYGVTVDQHQLSVTISDSGLANETYVATSGTYDVLVDTQAGAIKAGDYVTISAIDGVAMKAGTSDKTVFGRAVGGFDGKADSIGSMPLKDTHGSTTQTVQLGLVPVAINIQRNPNEKSTKANLPSALQRIGEQLADKQVSMVRIYMSAAVAVMSVIVAVVMLYSGIRGGLISIGRNPLSKKTIFRGLLEVVIGSVLILLIGLFAVYLLLKL